MKKIIFAVIAAFAVTAVNAQSYRLSAPKGIEVNRNTDNVYRFSKGYEVKTSVAKEMAEIELELQKLYAQPQSQERDAAINKSVNRHDYLSASIMADASSVKSFQGWGVGVAAGVNGDGASLTEASLYYRLYSLRVQASMGYSFGQELFDQSYDGLYGLTGLFLDLKNRNAETFFNKGFAPTFSVGLEAGALRFWHQADRANVYFDAWTPTVRVSAGMDFNITPQTRGGIKVFYQTYSVEAAGWSESKNLVGAMFSLNFDLKKNPYKK